MEMCTTQLAGGMPCSSLFLHTKNNTRKKPPRYSSCKAAAVDRRDVLLGLGGTAASGLATSYLNGGALAQPILPPDIRQCTPLPDIDCCPPYDPVTDIIDFKPPPCQSPLRVRPAAHLVDDHYLQKYEMAVCKMKTELRQDDPRSFEQQWRVHCAYCDAAYHQVGFPKLELEIHSCWLFFPWHRMYLYFHERILGKLIGDETFALPFWNWDAPDGMMLPGIYDNCDSPLYDTKRNAKHQLPDFPVDLNYGGRDPRIPRAQLIDQNLKTMYRQMISGAKKPPLFFGQPYRQGDKPNPGAGTIEHKPHNLVHNWTGDPCDDNNGEDMGVLATAARDPIFFAHHANVDRMWYVWNNTLERPNITDPDWLDAAFLFYDEEGRLVRCRVGDFVDTTALRYTYQDVPLLWRESKPTKEAGGEQSRPTKLGTLPATLNETVRVNVKRPRTSRSPTDKVMEEEVLVVDGIEVRDRSMLVKFDVIVTRTFESDSVSAGAAQNAGSFTLLPHGGRADRKAMSVHRTAARFGISDLIDEIGADKDSTIAVTLVPRSAGEAVTVGDVRIEYIK